MYIPKRTENICSHKNLCRNVNNSTFHNSQEVETPKHPPTDGQNVVCPYNRILFGPNKE